MTTEKPVQKDYSLLPELNGKTVVIKDFTLIHDKPSETRAGILAIFRDAYDGYASRKTGNSDTKGYHSKFNLITGMTPDIEKSWSLNTLGERFLMYRMSIGNRREHARRSFQNANDSKAIRQEMRTKVKEFIDSVPKDKSAIPTASEEMREKILDLAELLSTCRTYVQRDRNDAVLYPPAAELASRVTKQLLRIGQSVALVRGKSEVTEAEFGIMKRVSLDSLPTNRRLILAALWKHKDMAQPKETFENEITSVSKTTITRTLDDLYRLKVITRESKKIKVPHPVTEKETTTTANVYQFTKTYLDYCNNVGGIPSP